MRHEADFMITEGTKFQTKDVELVFDYLFHKQCMRAVKKGIFSCRRQDFAIAPVNAENPDGLWQFVTLSDSNEVLTDKTFKMDEMIRISKKVLFITNALKMREFFCELPLKDAYI